MKRLLCTCILLPVILLATTNHTITIDGTNDFASDEDLSTTTTGYTNYLTWDASNLYIGFAGTDVDDDEVSYYIFIDTDPQSTPSSGTGSTTHYSQNDDTMTLPFTINYSYINQVSAASPTGTPGSNAALRSWNGSSWVIATFNGSLYQNTDYHEVRIPWTDIGSPSQIYIAMSMTGPIMEEGLGDLFKIALAPSGNFAGSPSGAFSDGTGAVTFTEYFGYNITTGVSPDESAAVDRSLPVELSYFLGQSTEKGVCLSWATDSEIENQGFILSRKSRNGTWQEITSFLDTKALLGQGSSTEVNHYEYTDNQVVEGHTYSYRLSDVDYRGCRTDHSKLDFTLTHNIPAHNSRPGSFELTDIFPNPFNPTVTLSYNVLEACDMQFSIHNILGEQVLMETQDNHPGGMNQKWVWNGRLQDDQMAPAGVYILSLRSTDKISTKKVTLLY